VKYIIAAEIFKRASQSEFGHDNGLTIKSRDPLQNWKGPQILQGAHVLLPFTLP